MDRPDVERGVCPPDHPQERPEPQDVWIYPKLRVTVDKTFHEFVSREGVLRSARGVPWFRVLRFVAAADLVGLDTAALRRFGRTKTEIRPDFRGCV